YRFKSIEAIGEGQPLDFHSPYGCSKGGADQYVLDYARYLGLPSCVFRMSCIYGPRQFGIEDQGWVAWFMIAAVKNRPITIYGTGKQVRDVLYIDDLVDAFLLALEKPDESGGQAFNVGGGPENTWSLLELIEFIEEKLGKKIELKFDAMRPGDQRIYISDISKIKGTLGWQPKVDARDGATRLLDWIRSNPDIFP
ncbi:MAG TPA: NAD-dependent epimerase/dehydratase family protein, partial [Proteobacteria bacterium]|nr:NAD-dependent epimerase/dehydratase family protein [Pseudomonadota bacterium]